MDVSSKIYAVAYSGTQRAAVKAISSVISGEIVERTIQNKPFDVNAVFFGLRETVLKRGRKDHE
jgi:hypothetical protein